MQLSCMSEALANPTTDAHCHCQLNTARFGGTGAGSRRVALGCQGRSARSGVSAANGGPAMSSMSRLGRSRGTARAATSRSAPGARLWPSHRNSWIRQKGRNVAELVRRPGGGRAARRPPPRCPTNVRFAGRRTPPNPVTRQPVPGRRRNRAEAGLFSATPGPAPFLRRSPRLLPPPARAAPRRGRNPRPAPGCPRW